MVTPALVTCLPSTTITTSVFCITVTDGGAGMTLEVALAETFLLAGVRGSYRL